MLNTKIVLGHAALSLLYSCCSIAIVAVCGIANADIATQTIISPPVNVVQSVNGVSVTVPIRAESIFQTNGDIARVKIEVTGDLADLQEKIGTIIDTLALPRENCRSFSSNNPVVAMSHKALSFQDGDAVLLIGGNVTVWDCRENPVPNSKVEFEMQALGLGIRTKVPVVRTWPGEPIKNVLLTQSFDVSLPTYFAKLNDSTFGLKLGKPDIELKGQYVAITKGVLSIAGINLNDKLYDALTNVVDPQKLLLRLPGEIRALPLRVEDAHFVLSDGHLAATIILSGEVAVASVAHVQQLLASSPPPAQ